MRKRRERGGSGMLRRNNLIRKAFELFWSCIRSMGKSTMSEPHTPPYDDKDKDNAKP